MTMTERKKLTADDFNQLIDDTIQQLADDQINSGVDCLYLLANACKTAGMAREDFNNLCKYIEHEAAKKTDAKFLKAKIRAAIQQRKKLVTVLDGSALGIQ